MVGNIATTSAASSIPVMYGIVRSANTRSTRPVRSSSSAPAALSASKTSAPSSSSMERAISRTSKSSSTSSSLAPDSAWTAVCCVGNGLATGALARARGRYRLTVVPWPGWLVMRTPPPSCCATPSTCGRPRPEPRPTSLVV